MKLIPLTTEMMIREHTRKTFLKNLKKAIQAKILLREGPLDDTGDFAEDEPTTEEIQTLKNKDAAFWANKYGVKANLSEDETRGLVAILQNEESAYAYAECIDLLNELIHGKDDSGGPLEGITKYGQGMASTLNAMDIEGGTVKKAIIEFFGLVLQDPTDDLFFTRLALANFAENYNTWPEFIFKFVGEEVVTFGMGKAYKASKPAIAGLSKSYRAAQTSADAARASRLAGAVEGQATSIPAGGKTFYDPLSAEEITELERLLNRAGSRKATGTGRETLHKILSLAPVNTADPSGAAKTFLKDALEDMMEDAYKLGKDAPVAEIDRIAGGAADKIYDGMLESVRRKKLALEETRGDMPLKEFRETTEWKNLNRIEDGLVNNEAVIIQEIKKEVAIPIIEKRRRSTKGLMDAGLDADKAKEVIKRASIAREALHAPGRDGIAARFREVASGNYARTMEAARNAGARAGIPGNSFTVATSALKYIFRGSVPGRGNIFQAMQKIGDDLYERYQEAAKDRIMLLSVTDENACRSMLAGTGVDIIELRTRGMAQAVLNDERKLNRIMINLQNLDNEFAASWGDQTKALMNRYGDSQIGANLRGEVQKFLDSADRLQYPDFKGSEESAYYLLRNAVLEAANLDKGLSGPKLAAAGFTRFIIRVLCGAHLSHTINNIATRAGRSQVSGLGWAEVAGAGILGTIAAPNIVVRSAYGKLGGETSTVPLTERERQLINRYYERQPTGEGIKLSPTEGLEVDDPQNITNILSDTVLKSVSQRTDTDVPDKIKQQVSPDYSKAALAYFEARMAPLIYLGEVIDDAGDAVLGIRDDLPALGKLAGITTSTAAQMDGTSKNPFPEQAERVYDMLLNDRGIVEYLSAADVGKFYESGISATNLEARPFYDIQYADLISEKFLDAANTILDAARSQKRAKAIARDVYKEFASTMEDYEAQRKAEFRAEPPDWSGKGDNSEVAFIADITSDVIAQQKILARSGINQTSAVAYNALKKKLIEVGSISAGGLYVQDLEEGVINGKLGGQLINENMLREIVRSRILSATSKKKRVLRENKTLTEYHLQQQIKNALTSVKTQARIFSEGDLDSYMDASSTDSEGNSFAGFTYGLPVKDFYDNTKYEISAYSGLIKFKIDKTDGKFLTDSIEYADFTKISDYKPQALDFASYELHPLGSDGKPDNTQDKIIFNVALEGSTQEEVRTRETHPRIKKTFKSVDNVFRLFKSIHEEITTDDYSESEKNNFVELAESRKNSLISAYNAIKDRAAFESTDEKFVIPVVVFGRFKKDVTTGTSLNLAKDVVADGEISQTTYTLNSADIADLASYNGALSTNAFAFYTPVDSVEESLVEISQKLKEQAESNGFVVKDSATLDEPPTPPEEEPEDTDAPEPGTPEAEELKKQTEKAESKEKLRSTIKGQGGSTPGFAESVVGSDNNDYQTYANAAYYALNNDLDLNEEEGKYENCKKADLVNYIKSVDTTKDPIGNLEGQGVVREVIEHALQEDEPIFASNSDLEDVVRGLLGEGGSPTLGRYDSVLKNNFPETYGIGVENDLSGIAALMYDIAHGSTAMSKPIVRGERVASKTQRTEKDPERTSKRTEKPESGGRVTRNGYVEVIDDTDFFATFPLFSRYDFEKFLTAQVQNNYIRDIGSDVSFRVELNKKGELIRKSTVKLGRSGRGSSQERKDVIKIFGKEGVMSTRFEKTVETFLNNKITLFYREYKQFKAAQKGTDSPKAETTSTPAASPEAQEEQLVNTAEWFPGLSADQKAKIKTLFKRIINDIKAAIQSSERAKNKTEKKEKALYKLDRLSSELDKIDEDFTPLGKIILGIIVLLLSPVILLFIGPAKRKEILDEVEAYLEELGVDVDAIIAKRKQRVDTRRRKRETRQMERDKESVDSGSSRQLKKLERNLAKVARVVDNLPKKIKRERDPMRQTKDDPGGSMVPYKKAALKEIQKRCDEFQQGQADLIAKGLDDELAETFVELMRNPAYLYYDDKSIRLPPNPVTYDFPVKSGSKQDKAIQEFIQDQTLNDLVYFAMGKTNIKSAKDIHKIIGLRKIIGVLEGTGTSKLPKKYKGRKRLDLERATDDIKDAVDDVIDTYDYNPTDSPKDNIVESVIRHYKVGQNVFRDSGKKPMEIINFFLDPSKEGIEFTFAIKSTAQGRQSVQEVPVEDLDVTLAQPPQLPQLSENRKRKVKVSKAFRGK